MRPTDLSRGPLRPGRRARLIGLGAALGAAAALAWAPGAGSAAPWSWRAAGVVASPVACPAPGRAVGTEICRYALPDAPAGAGAESITVTVTDGGPARACYGLSISSSVAAGLRQLCVGTHRTGRLRLAGPAGDFRATTLEVFATSGSPDRPIAPQRARGRSPFVVRVQA